MATFLFTYRMPEDYTPGRADAMAAWNSWFDGMGASVIDRGNPAPAHREQSSKTYGAGR